MDKNTYKTRKFDKLGKDIVGLVNELPSFGYGAAVDMLIKASLSNHLQTLIVIAETFDTDIEILSQSIADDLQLLTRDALAHIVGYKTDISRNETE